MAEIYISLFDGLLHDSEAIEMIRKFGVISGIEVYSLNSISPWLKILG